MAKVVDFGLVKDLDAADALSREGLLVGTPHYLAPEAIRSQDADARADLCSARRPRTADEAAEALDKCGTETWTREHARSWWAGKGRALAAVRGEAVQPTLLTVSRAFEYDLKKAARPTA